MASKRCAMLPVPSSRRAEAFGLARRPLTTNATLTSSDSSMRVRCILSALASQLTGMRRQCAARRRLTGCRLERKLTKADFELTDRQVSGPATRGRPAPAGTDSRFSPTRFVSRRSPAEPSPGVGSAADKRYS